jgi:hypothetical protein
MLWNRLYGETKHAVAAALDACGDPEQLPEAASLLGEALSVPPERARDAIERCARTVPNPRGLEEFTVCLFGRLGL